MPSSLHTKQQKDCCQWKQWKVALLLQKLSEYLTFWGHSAHNWVYTQYNDALTVTWLTLQPKIATTAPWLVLYLFPTPLKAGHSAGLSGLLHTKTVYPQIHPSQYYLGLILSSVTSHDLTGWKSHSAPSPEQCSWPQYLIISNYGINSCDNVPEEMCTHVRWMCGIKLQYRVPSNGLRETRIRWHNLGTTATGRNGMGMCCKKKTMIGWRNVWSMKWRVPDQRVDHRKLEDRLWKNTVRHINWTERMPWIIIDGGSR